MNDDLAYVTQRIPNYRGYDSEQHRHASDMLVRGYLGEALTGAQTLLGATFSVETKNVFEAVLYRCMFTDQIFVRKFDHAELDEPTLGALLHSDRVLIGYAEDAKVVTSEGLLPLLRAIDAQFDYRRSPVPLVD